MRHAETQAPRFFSVFRFVFSAFPSISKHSIVTAPREQEHGRATTHKEGAIMDKDNPQGRMKRLGQVAVSLRPDRLKAVDHAAIDAGVNRSQFICRCIDAYFEGKKKGIAQEGAIPLKA